MVQRSEFVQVHLTFGPGHEPHEPPHLERDIGARLGRFGCPTGVVSIPKTCLIQPEFCLDKSLGSEGLWHFGFTKDMKKAKGTPSCNL